jgi:hypothetical protein
VGRRRAAIAAAIPVVLLTGCGDLSDDEVRDVATAFAGADADGRCALLAPGTLSAFEEDGPGGCAAAVEELPLGSGEVTSIEVWGQEAQAVLADDTLFLTRTARGWRISAGACTSQGPERPYDCRLESA